MHLGQKVGASFEVADLYAAHVGPGGVGDAEEVGLGGHVDRDAQVGLLALDRGEELAATAKVMVSRARAGGRR